MSRFLDRLSSPEGGAVGAPPKACAKPSLASPFGGRWCPVGTVQRLTEPAGESAPQRGAERATRQRPAQLRVPRRRLYQRAAHALGGVTGKRSGNYAGPNGPVREPPARVPCEKPSAGSLFYLPALADATKTVGRRPTPCQLSFVESWAKNFTRLRRARELAS